MKSRRSFIKTGAAGAVALGAMGLLPVSGRLAFAGEIDKRAFASKAVDQVLDALGARNAQPTTAIDIAAPPVAENGALVPVTVTSRIPNTESIAVIIDDNPNPLAAHVRIAAQGEPYVAQRLRIGKYTDIRVVVVANGQHYVATRKIKVTLSGCAG